MVSRSELRRSPSPARAEGPRKPLRRAWSRRARAGSIGAASALAVAACLAPLEPEPTVDAAAFDPATLYEPHVEPGDDGRFFNPWRPFARSWWKVLRWQFTRNTFDRSRPPQVPTVENDGAYLRSFEPGASVTWVGHATLAVHEGDDVFLTDPHFTKRALIPARLQPPGIPLEAVPPDAFAVVSHNHYDHLDAGTVEALPESFGWYVPLGFGEWFRDRGRTNVVELDWWQSAKRGNWTITCLPSQHWTNRIEQPFNAVLWCSWLIDSGKRRYFFGGDTGYFHGFREFGQRYAPIDVALLPIGAYAPRWFMRYQHMDPAEAYRAFLDLGASHMIGMHWGTFDLTDEPLDRAPIELREAVQAAGGDASRALTLAIGERWFVPERALDTQQRKDDDATRARLLP